MLPQSWKDAFRPLLDNNFLSLKTLTILITSDEDDDVTEWVNSFNELKYVKRLRSDRGLDVSVLEKTNLGKLLFAVKPTRQISDKQSRRHTGTSVCERSGLGMCHLWLRQSGFGNTVVDYTDE